MKFRIRRQIKLTTRACALGIIRCYQVMISPILGPACRFYPTCSEYAKEAIEHHGMIRGTGLTVKRVLKCHPFHPGGYDPIP